MKVPFIVADMSDIKNRDRILEAIDQLRRRKARPDVNRICNFLMRRFSVSCSDTKADLQRCVENDIVLKVEYKGNISYRNAAKKYAQLKRDSQGELIANSHKPNRKFADILTNAIAQLVLQEPDYLEIGVPENELIRNILAKDNVKYTRKYVSILLEKQVECGGLIKMDNGNYLMGPTKTEKSDDSDNSVRDKPPSSYIIQIKPRKKPGPKPGFKREKLGDSEADDKRGDGGNLRVGGRRKVRIRIQTPHNLYTSRMFLF